jgi:hypothetical protein
MDKYWLEAEVFKQFENQTKNLITLAQDKDQLWSWRVERILSKHILIRFGLHHGSLRPTWYSLVWPKNKDLSLLDTQRGFIQLVRAEELTLQHNLADILHLFRFYQNGQDKSIKILHHLTDIDEDFIVARPAVVERYAQLVKPPYCSKQGSSQLARFWAVDWLEQSLEEWLLIQTEDDLSIQLLTQEKGFVV